MGFLDSFRTPDLDRLTTQQDVAGLSKAARHKKPDVRLKAVSALAQIGDARAVPALLLCLNDEVAQVRRSSAAGLALLGDYRALVPLAALIKDEDELAAVWAKEFLASAVVVGAGSHASHEFIAGVHKQRGVRQAALDAMNRIYQRLPRGATVRIPADPNHRSEDDLLRLDQPDAMKALEQYRGRLEPGLLVVFYGEGYEMDGVLVSDEQRQAWLGIPRWETWRDLPSG
jgi:hypothetical protein